MNPTPPIPPVHSVPDEPEIVSAILLRQWFEQALLQSAEDRDAWLVSQLHDPATLAAVKRLLKADEDAGALDVPPLERAMRIGDTEDAVDDWIGQSVGPFKLTAVLGQGGMAAVFLGERDDGDFRQRVAIKVLRRGLYSDVERRLFRRERQALAALSHPNIAHFIDGGVTDAGLPFLAMEFVDGSTLIDYVRDAGLGVRARLQLLVVICRAVGAAHTNLIVHRDIKPSNILVTGAGDVKLLDFGIAKLLDDGDDGATRTGMAALTPGYAAPEQFDGGVISTATDVYALGVLLHELLLGVRPDSSDPGSRRPSDRIVPTRMSPDAALGPAALRTVLRGDIDNIVMKCLATEPERRYRSAHELADDIDRHLADQPVTAHPPSRWYRTSKFVQRHRGGVAITVALLLAVFAALGVALWQAGVARKEAYLAMQHAERAQAVRDLLVDLFDTNIPSRPGNEMPSTAEVLARGAERALHDLNATPAVQSDLLVALGRVYDHLALPDKGEPLLDAAVAAARRVDPPDPALLGAALSERGELELSRDRFVPALAYFEQALAQQKHPDEGGLALALTLDRRALAESQTGQHDAAITDYQTALAIRRKRLPADDPEILNGLSALGNAYNRAGHPVQGSDPLRTAMQGALRHFGENHVKTAHYIKNYAANQSMLRQFPEAAALTKRAVSIERALYPPGSPDIVNGLNNLGVIELGLGRLHAAREVLMEGRTRNRDAGLEISMGQTFVLGNLARVEEHLGETTQALELLRSAVKSATEVVGADHARTQSLFVQQAHLELAADADKAATIATHLKAILDHPEALAQFRGRSEIEARYSLGLAQATLGQDQQAGENLQRAVDQIPLDYLDPLLLPAVVALAEWQHAHGAESQAKSLLRQTIDRASRELPATHYALGELHLVVAEMLASQQPREAEEQANAAAEGFTELSESHPLRQRLVIVTQRLNDSP